MSLAMYYLEFMHCGSLSFLWLGKSPREYVCLQQLNLSNDAYFYFHLCEAIWE